MLQTKQNNQSGFALYMTLMIVSIVISVMLSIVELSMQQLKLSVNNKDAEIAFQAASAGSECLQRVSRVADIDGSDMSFDCFGENYTTSKSNGSLASSDDSNTHRYRDSLDWGDDRCTSFDLIVVNAELGEVTIGGEGSASLNNIIANYHDSSLTCELGSVCRILAVSGFNKACGSTGTLKREMLLEF